MALVHHRNIKCLTSTNAKAFWELKHYWEDGCTIECRYFAKWIDAKDFAEQEGYTNYKIVPTDKNRFGKK